jgi:hypothetical protein
VALSVDTGGSVWCCECKVDITAVVYWYRIDKSEYEPIIWTNAISKFNIHMSSTFHRSVSLYCGHSECQYEWHVTDKCAFMRDRQLALLCFVQRYPPTQQLNAPSLMFVLAEDDRVQWL